MIESIETALQNGPLPLARAMALASEHYYATAEPFGAGGDFVTAPEISQVFGELIGLWMADLWERAGRPANVILVELGPGRGTLMHDAKRALAQAMPAFLGDVRLFLVERSGRLRALQAEALPTARFASRLADIPKDGPILLIANEFLDALPISQFERTEDGWAMRAVTRDGFDLSMLESDLLIPEPLRASRVGAVYERGFAGEALVAEVARRIDRQGGAALFVDYGYDGPAAGDTLQAIRDGAFADPLAHLGTADISAHVDFAAMAHAAHAAAPKVAVRKTAQGLFLEQLGIHQRAGRLKAGKNAEERATIEAAVARLVSGAAMGNLFQAMALTGSGWPEPAGFAE